LRLLVLFLLGCQTPRVPSEDRAREAYFARKKELDEVHLAVLDEVVNAGLGAERRVCSPPDGAQCLESLRDRDKRAANGRVRLKALLSKMSVLCAEIAVKSGALEELAVSVATCPPGVRGDRIPPESGTAIDDRTRLGRGVYFGADGVHHPGIAVQHAFTIETARVSSVFYYAID
jgi:hypothetical protein